MSLLGNVDLLRFGREHESMAVIPPGLAAGRDIFGGANFEP